MRRERIDLRVTEAEKRTWERKAAKWGLTLSDLLRYSVEALPAKPRKTA